MEWTEIFIPITILPVIGYIVYVTATRPIAVWERVAVASGLATVLALLWRYWPAVANTMASAAVPGDWPVRGTAATTLVTSLAVAGVALLCFRIWLALAFDRQERSRA